MPSGVARLNHAKEDRTHMLLIKAKVKLEKFFHDKFTYLATESTC